MISKVIVFAFVPLFIAATLSMLASAGDDDASNAWSQLDTLVIEVFTWGYDPSPETVEAGTVVKWVWVANDHSVTSGGYPIFDGIFDSGIQNSGFTFSYQFNSEGTFPYYCRNHGSSYSMTGTITVTGTVGTDDEGRSFIEGFGLMQNYPNPFNPETAIEYILPNASDITIVIYNLSGEVVELLVEKKQPAGYHNVTWNASNMASGIYFYRLQVRQTDVGQAGNFVQTRKMVRLK